MKHTKNILKSLLIMVMALSLLAVSCKKDEGGSKPTDPTVTISAANLLDSIKQIKAYKDTTLLVSFSKVDFSTTAGESTEVTTEANQSTFTEIQSGLKTTFDALANNTQFQVTTDINSVNKPADSEALNVTLTIKPATANIKFASDIIDGSKFKYQGGAAVLTVKIKPSAAWK